MTKLRAALMSLLAVVGAMAAHAESVRDRADAAYEAKSYAEAAPLYEQAQIDEISTSRRMNDWYNAACCWSLAGDPDRAFAALEQSRTLGLRSANHVARDPDLQSLREDPRWAAIYAQIESAEARLHDPENARIVTEDLHRFWAAHAKMKAEPARAAEILMQDYVLPGSPGLKDYYSLRIGSAEDFLANYRSMPRYYDSIREQSLRVEAARDQFDVAFTKMAEIYDEAVFPDITFVIGRFSSMGTVSNAGMLIGTDMMCAGEGVPLDELDDWKRRVVRNMDVLVPLVSHELIHSQQNIQQDGSNLMSAIAEGGADFIGELISGGLMDPEKYAWADEREAEIWSRFAEDMESSDTSDWFANTSSGTAEWPAEMGYYVGYKICRAYYEQAEDEKAAIATILNCNDAKAVLEASGYAARFED